MHSFGNIAGPLLAAQAHNRRKVRWLETLRGALLPRLISGKLRIPEVEDQLDEVFA
jgi:type I restriction enzyme S subunit